MKKVNSLFAVFVIVNCAIYFQIEAAFALSPSVKINVHKSLLAVPAHVASDNLSKCNVATFFPSDFFNNRCF